MLQNLTQRAVDEGAHYYSGNSLTIYHACVTKIGHWDSTSKKKKMLALLKLETMDDIRKQQSTAMAIPFDCGLQKVIQMMEMDNK